jgi:hypothetical protein
MAERLVSDRLHAYFLVVLKIMGTVSDWSGMNSLCPLVVVFSMAY